MTVRSTIRIDHAEGDPHIAKVIKDLRDRGYMTTHPKGLARTSRREG